MRPQSPSVEPLESRQLFSSVFFASFGGGGDTFGGKSGFTFGFTTGSGTGTSFNLSSQLVDLPRFSIGLPSQILNLPQVGTPPRSLPLFNVTPTLDLRGDYRGVANVLGVGSTRVNLSVLRQRAGTITATVRLPRLDLTFAGKAPITFLGNREFTFTLSEGSSTATVTARQNKSGSITGEILGQIDTRRLDATFSVRPIRNAS